MNKCLWPLENGQTLEFTIYSPCSNWNKVAGLYIFAHNVDGQHWRALYIGQTNDFSSRLPSHEKWDFAVQHGATHIHALVVSDECMRDLWEKRLIAHLQPQLNDQYKSLLRKYA